MKQSIDEKRKWIRILPTERMDYRSIYYLDMSDDIRYLFEPEQCFGIEWPFSVENMPESILIIPLLSQLLPAAWVLDIDIYLPSCDRDFYFSLEEVFGGYRQMYPMLTFGGRVIPDKLEKNRSPYESGKAIVCYSGGVDSFDTIIRHLDEKPTLVSLWGSDIFWEEEEAWYTLEGYLRHDAELLNLEQITVKSAFRKLLNQGILDRTVLISGDGWWHGFQHGIGILGHMAPVAWMLGADKVYIASSFTKDDHYTCASDPSIDNYVRYCGTRVIHDGYETDRQQKIINILNYSKKTQKDLSLHVCWEKRDGQNCCTCEKCWRTMMAILTEGADPRKYGFLNYRDVHSFETIIEENPAFFGINAVANFQPIQKRLRTLVERGENREELIWFLNLDLEQMAKRAKEPENQEEQEENSEEPTRSGSDCNEKQQWLRFLKPIFTKLRCTISK